jgi:hypothetical protein
LSGTVLNESDGVDGSETLYYSQAVHLKHEDDDARGRADLDAVWFFFFVLLNHA